MSDRAEPKPAGDFSLVLGGPLYRLFLKSRLARPPVELVRRRVAVLTGLAWLPLLVLAALEGVALGGVRIPFLKDLDAQVRLLVALPLLLAAEKVVHDRIGPAVDLFRDEGIVRPGDAARFAQIQASTVRWRNSFVVELCLLAVAFTMGHTVWTERLALHKDVWFASATPSGFELSRAGLWYAWFSLPLFQFLLLRWWYRLLLWFRFLLLVSRLNLNLSPSHPDRAGGLGFLGTSTSALVPVLMAQSALVSAMIATRILRQGAALMDFKLELGGALAFALLQALAPLLVFIPALAKAKRRGLYEYGTLSSRYVEEFDRKWIRGGADPGEALVGSADIQSLADLGNSFEIVKRMQTVPFYKETLVPLVLSTALPALPLVLTVIPLEELVKRLLGAIL